MIVDESELEDFMTRSFLGEEASLAKGLIDLVQAQVELYTGRPLLTSEATEHYVIGPEYEPSSDASPFYGASSATIYGSGTTPSYRIIREPVTLPLRRTPVISVSTVEVNGQPVTPGRGGFIARRWGLTLHSAVADDLVTVTYTAGPDESTAKALRLVVLRVAAREMTNKADQAVGLKDLLAKEPKQLEIGFTDTEVRILDRYRRRRIAR